MNQIKEFFKFNMYKRFEIPSLSFIGFAILLKIYFFMFMIAAVVVHDILGVDEMKQLVLANSLVLQIEMIIILFVIIYPIIYNIIVFMKRKFASGDLK